VSINIIICSFMIYYSLNPVAKYINYSKIDVQYKYCGVSWDANCWFWHKEYNIDWGINNEKIERSLTEQLGFNTKIVFISFIK